MNKPKKHVTADNLWPGDVVFDGKPRHVARVEPTEQFDICNVVFVTSTGLREYDRRYFWDSEFFLRVG